MTVRVSRKAVREATLIAAELGAADSRLADDFLRRLEEAWRLLAWWPELGRRRRFRDPRPAGLRSWPLRRFRNPLIFYRVVSNTVEIAGVIHGARDLARALREEAAGRTPS
ncbi:MAG TPA: type II toxin-antitoxin system RelE/ParE family toxin [Verrucomicrobiota bacterium]|nr:type II toxin-antitoxin system RelE/ParE family toxin [Verrucomicrobiota bacterium]